MRTSARVVGLSWLIVAMAVTAAGIGLVWRNSGEQFTFASVRGQAVEIYGEGLYRYDSLFTGAGNKGTDLIVLSVGVPLLIIVSLLYRKGSIRGGLVLLGVLTYFLYVYAGYALGTTAFNELFFLYVALFSASLYAFVLAFMSFDANSLADRFASTIPRRGPALLLFASGVVTIFVWAVPVLTAQLQGEAPEGLGHYTTLFTYALDLAVITPATFIAGILILRRAAMGYLLAFPLLVLLAMLAPLIAVQTAFQLAAGLTFTPAEIIGPMVGFAILALVSVGVLTSILWNISSVQEREEMFGKGASP